MKRIGITGITGGFGRRLGEIIIEHDFKIFALIRKQSNVKGISPLINVIYGDVCDYDSLYHFIKDIDICIHLAAQISYSSYESLFDTNVRGTENVCKAIIMYNPNCRLIYCSTISTLKVNPAFKFLSSSYGISKYFAEKRVLHYMKEDKLHATIIYPGLIYGFYDRSFLPQIIAALKKGSVKLLKGGERNAPLIYSDELADLFIKAALSPICDGKRYISVKGIELGIHDAVKAIAVKTNNIVPSKIHSKRLYFIFALFFETIFRIFKLKGKPPINRTVVDVLSINFEDYKKSYDDPKVDLGWEQNTSREYFEQNIEKILAHNMNS
jgi:nucleoside-diphosphate-sugar epimerase